VPGQRRIPRGRALLLAALLAATAAVLVVVLPRPADGAGDLPPVPDDAPRVAFVGDSWTKGAGATDGRGYAVLTGERLRWHASVLGVGGSGYTRRGPGDHGSTFGERIDAAVATGADVIVVQGSLNERRGTLAELAPAAAETLTRLRAVAAPDTEIVVIGAPYNPDTPDRTIDGINRAIEAAAEGAGVLFVDPAAQLWLDPADDGLWADGIHPNDAGHEVVAGHVVELLLATVRH
jgi:lysophospholipase L1-like esterase